MKVRTLTTALIFILLALQANASIYCPADITLHCDDDIYYLPVTGKATAPLYPPSWIKYQDISSLNQCNVGTLQRIWYVDMNQNNKYESTEPHCQQILTLMPIEGTVVITWPENRTFSCKEDIEKEKPTWTQGPCDVLGYHVEESVYEVADDACFKIFRKFTVINWCTYGSGIPGQGIWEHTQVIKVVEKDPPVIADCTAKILPLENDCRATFTISNSAADQGKCPTKLVSWVVDIDLWGNGTVDYRYGYNEPGKFRLEPVAGGTTINITLDERVAAGKHKVHWSVRDECGNYTSCLMYVETKDIKKPTPYLHQYLISSFDATQMPAMISPRLFNVGSTDNCTPANWLKYSFSPNVNDTVRVVNCTNAGFQFFTIYITDHAGNQEAIDVFMLVFDNGSCFATANFAGRFKEHNGRSIQEASAMLQRPGTKAMAYPAPDGTFMWEDVLLFSDYKVIPEVHEATDDRVDIADLRMLTDHIMGISRLSDFQLLAADLNGDHRVRATDLVLLKELILNPESQLPGWKLAIDTDTIQKEADLALIKGTTDIMKYDGKIDITATCIGDITDANDIKTENRSYADLEAKTSDTQTDYYLPEAQQLRGLQLEVLVNAGDCRPELISDYFDKTDVWFDESKNSFRVLAANDISADRHKPLFSLVNCNNLKGEAQITPYSRLLLADNSVALLRETKSNGAQANIVLYPNPGEGSFTLKNPGTEILGISDLAGRSVSYQRLQNTVNIQGQSGLYFVKTNTNTSIKIIRLIVR